MGNHLFHLPSGKHTKNDGTSPFFMGKSTINGPFSLAMLNNQRIHPIQSLWIPMGKPYKFHVFLTHHGPFLEGHVVVPRVTRRPRGIFAAATHAP